MGRLGLWTEKAQGRGGRGSQASPGHAPLPGSLLAGAPHPQLVMTLSWLQHLGCSRLQFLDEEPEVLRDPITCSRPPQLSVVETDLKPCEPKTCSGLP